MRLIRFLLNGFADYSGFEKGDRELEVHMASHGPGNWLRDAKSVSHQE